MNRKKNSLFYTVIICLVLIVVILITFFQAVLGNDKPQPQKEISVILYSAGDEGWESFEEGLAQAEKDFSVNINCVMLRDSEGAEEQFAAIERAIANGTEGIILAVSDDSELYELWCKKSYNVPVVTVESGFNESTIPFLSADNYEMGKRLGEEILKDFASKEDLRVAVYASTLKRNSVKEREEGLRDALDGKADIISFKEVIKSDDADVSVALDKEALLALANRANLKNQKNYGIGNATSIVAALEQGKIEKLVFQNEFNMGYLAVEMLLEELDGKDNTKDNLIDFYCVGREDLYNTPYEQLMFPIVE